MPEEPLISVNGRPCSIAEAMTIRVAVAAFAEQLQSSDSLGADDHGRHMREGYLKAVGLLAEKMRTS